MGTWLAKSSVHTILHQPGTISWKVNFFWDFEERRTCRYPQRYIAVVN